MSKAPMRSADALLDNEHASLVAEFTSLQKQQWESLDRAIYVGMTPTEAQEYERRARRITELQRMLGINLNIPMDNKRRGDL